MIDRVTQLTGIAVTGKPRSKSTTIEVKCLTLVVKIGSQPPKSVKQYPIDRLNSAIRTAVGIVRQNRSAVCAVFDNRRVKQAKIERAGMLGGKIKITRFYGGAKTREVLRKRDIESLSAESYV